jgi:hypothetical protein
MTSLGFSDALSLTQTIAIIVTLLVTLYFSRRQLRTMSVDLETRVLNDLDEKLHGLISIFIQSPKLVKTIYDAPFEITEEMPFAYNVLFMRAHAYHMRERGVLGDNEWAGWLQWMKNAFQYGRMRKYWKENQMETWFDPSFRNFVNTELVSAGASKTS